jgi:hypothetical protein
MIEEGTRVSLHNNFAKCQSREVIIHDHIALCYDGALHTVFILLRWWEEKQEVVSNYVLWSVLCIMSLSTATVTEYPDGCRLSMI